MIPPDTSLQIKMHYDVLEYFDWLENIEWPIRALEMAIFFLGSDP